MLEQFPLAALLIGLTLYVVLGGADFGAGIWHLLAGGGERGRTLRDHAHHSVGPVWEANHVWLIFALTVLWTAYPVAFGSITSTLAVPLFVAALGIIVRGTAYALRSGTRTTAERRRIDYITGIASLVTPLALGAGAGAIATGRVPVGNAAGSVGHSFINPTSALVAVLAVAISAYMAAVFLAADARRLGESELERAFRTRALVSAGVAGVLAVAGLVVLHHDAPRLAHALLHRSGRPALALSIVAGLLTVVLIQRGSLSLARLTSACAVAAIVAGWAIAQRPFILPGLTVHEAATSRSTLIAVTVAIVGGAALLIPALWVLFSLVLRGRFDEGQQVTAAFPARGDERVVRGRAVWVTIALGAIGAALIVIGEGDVFHVTGLVLMLGAVAFLIPALARRMVVTGDHGGERDD